MAGQWEKDGEKWSACAQLRPSFLPAPGKRNGFRTGQTGEDTGNNLSPGLPIPSSETRALTWQAGLLAYGS
jgi:hypothetical protein